jgi:Fic family protein
MSINSIAVDTFWIYCQLNLPYRHLLHEQWSQDMKPENFRSSTTGQVIRTSPGYWAFVPNPLPPEIKWSPKIISLLSEADRNLTKLAEIGNTFPKPHILVQPFIHQEAVLSSKIEGTRTSLEQLYTFEAMRGSLSSPGSDAREVHNYVRALDFGLARLKSLPVSLRLIREIHKILMEGVRGDHFTPGEFRHSPNWIGPPGTTLENATFVPPPVDEMHAGLDNLEKFLHNYSDLPPLIRLGLVHYQFEAIHPFLDGNGRIGRLLIILLLCEWKLLHQPLLILSAYFEANQQEYYDRLLAVSQQGDWGGWLCFFLEGVRNQSQDTVARIQRLENLLAKYRLMLQDERDADRLLQVVDYLIEQPVVTVRQVELGIGVSDYKIAQRYVEKLQAFGIIREITGKPRNRIYLAERIFMAIEEPI